MGASIGFQYNALGQVIRKDAAGVVTTFEYDLGRRTGRTTPGGVISSWTYDPAGRRESLTTAGRTMTFERDAGGQEVVRRVGESVSLSHGYDVMGRMTEQCVSSHGRSLQRREYAYRADGNLTGYAKYRSHREWVRSSSPMVRSWNRPTSVWFPNLMEPTRQHAP
ncbi:RHS repeat protein [Streptomyces sp. ISL-94]|uniref:RHS repeat protein n=1 Tax=Streptomyces sp. ISL-94 TaxID=2819190 RepID=UPI002035E699|nr:RHS repeat protein [Streptomyces sp. ISL-94]